MDSTDAKSIYSISEQVRADNTYKLCGKLFLNKKFSKCYCQIHQLYEESFGLYECGKINGALFENIVKLYITVSGLVLSQNSKHRIVPGKSVSSIRNSFEEDAMLHRVISAYSNGLPEVPIEIMFSIFVISYTNDIFELSDLQRRIESYFTVMNYGVYQTLDDKELENFNNILQLYVLNVLPRQRLSDLAEEFIMTNPYIKEKDEYMELLNEAVSQVKENELNKAKQEQMKKVKEERIRKQREEEEKKARQESDYQARLRKRAQEQSDFAVTEKEPVRTQPAFNLLKFGSYKLLIEQIINTDYLKHNYGYALMLLFLVLLWKKLMSSGRRRDFTRIVRFSFSKLKSTFSMALKVSYV